MARKRSLSLSPRRALIAGTAVVGTVAASLFGVGGSAASADGQPLYLNQHAAPDARAADLVGRMTLAEKIGQMTQIEVDKIVGDCNYGAGPLNPTCAQQVLGDAAVGSILSGGGSPPTQDETKDSPQDWATAVNGIVQYSIDHNPLHIPVIYGADVVHGHNNVQGDTLFPQEIGFGATYDPQLVQAAQQSAAKAADATNVRWAFGPVADVDRDSRWGRYYESFGEDPTEDGALAAASVKGLQGSGQVAASVKHFAGYGGASSGLDRTDADMSQRWLQDDELPSYQGGINGGGADTVMVDSGAINGVPVTSSHYLLTTVLRQQMHFTGVAVSDWADIAALMSSYHIAGDYEHAAADAINAGVDMAMEPFDAQSWESAVTSAVKDHLVSVDRINQAAERVLALKFRTGVFDHPFVDASKADQTVGADAPLARQAAAESTVVLQNSNSVLPLKPTAKITVTGPSADSVANTLGGWSIGWQGVPDGNPEPAVTVAQGLKNGGSNVTLAGTQAQAVAAAGSTDDYVVVVGNGPGAEGPNDQRDPSLPAAQQAEVAALVATGKPVVVVVVDDRPLAMGSLVNSAGTGINAAGLVMAWRPGSQGGNGVADVLYGQTNPSGRLPVSWPKSGTDNPNSYLLLSLPSTENNGSPTYQPLYAFGAGLSYTDYSFGAVSAKSQGNNVSVRVAVKNGGAMAGDLVVPVYVSQPVSDPVQPAKRLAGFTRVHLAAGQSSTVTVTFPRSQLAITGGDLDSSAPRSVEHGQYVFSSGALGSALPTNASASLTF